MRVSIEKETGRPLQFQSGCLPEVMLMSGAGASTPGSTRCAMRWREPEPTQTTASTEVRKEKTERSWSTESERKSLMVDSRGRVDTGVACVDVGWTVLAALADAANDELGS